MRGTALAIFTLCMAAGQALGAVSATTSFRPFVVKGHSARAIYLSVLAHSRKKDGFNTFATTDVSLKPKVRLVSKPRCKIASAAITARFVVHLPQLATEAQLAPGLKADWRSFVAGLEKHELHHREIWLGCAANIAAAATSIPAGDCQSFAHNLETRIAAENHACAARNAAFDAEAQTQLPGFAFIQRAVAGK